MKHTIPQILEGIIVECKRSDELIRREQIRNMSKPDLAYLITKGK